MTTKGEINLKVILGVSKYFNIGVDLIFAKTREWRIVYARHMVWYILREHYNLSYPYIGELTGGRDHTSIIHGVRRIKNDPEKLDESQKVLFFIKNMYHI